MDRATVPTPFSKYNCVIGSFPEVYCRSPHHLVIPMKHSYLIPFALCAILTPLSIAADHSVETSITEVSLFRDGALVTRQGSLSVPAGKSTLVFNNLPSQVDPTALQANFTNEPSGVIRNAKIFQPRDREENKTIEAIRERLDEAKKTKEKKTRILSEAKADISFASSMRDSFSEEFGKLDGGQSLSLQQAKELADFVAQTKVNAYTQIDTVEIEIKAIDKTIKEIEMELAKANETAVLLSSIAEVEIEMDEAGEVGIALSYLANDAHWGPQYELRAFPDRGSLEFGYFASVWQFTGEDWSDIELSLQTNQANRQGNVPELYPLNVSQREDYARKQSFEMRMQRIPDSSAEVLYSSSQPAQAISKLSDQRTAISSTTVSFQATIPGNVTVPSARESSASEVLEESVEAEFWSESVPRIQLDAYLRAKMRNTLALPILPGQARAFVDGKLSSKVHLDKILPEEETEISLGTDGNIIVTRTEGAQKDSNSGFIDKTTTLNREYKNEVTNLHSVAHKVIIVDQFPIAQNTKIEIRRKAPPSSDVEIEDENDGIFKWEATLAPKEEKTFTTAYEVIYPRDWNLFPEL